MQVIFTPKNEKEKDLCDVIMYSQHKNLRKKALKKLRELYNDIQKDVIPSIQSIEYYDSIPGKPSYFRRFRSAVIMRHLRNQ